MQKTGTSLIVDKDGFFTGSYNRIFDPRNLELSYESSNLVLEDVDSAFDEVVGKRNLILSRRKRFAHSEHRPHRATEKPIFVPSREAFSEACDDYIRRSPSRYSCSPRRSGIHTPAQHAFTLSEISDSVHQDISDRCGSPDISHLSVGTDIVHSLTHRLAGFAISKSTSTISDSMCKSYLSRSAYKAPLSVSTTKCLKSTLDNLSASIAINTRGGCLQLLSSQGSAPSSQIIIQPSANPTSSSVEMRSIKTSYLTVSRAGLRSQTIESLGKPSLTINVKTLKPP